MNDFNDASEAAAEQDDEQPLTEEETKQRAREMVLALETMALITKKTSNASLNEKIMRWQRLLADLKHSIDVLKLIVNELPADSPERVGYLEHLYKSMMKHWNASGELSVLNDSIEAWEQIVAKTPPDNKDLPVMLNFLVYAYSTRGERTKNQADWDLSMQLQEQALALCKPGSFYHMQCLFNLGGMLNIRYSSSRNLAALNRAIDLLEQAVALLSPQSQHVRADYLRTLADALKQRFERTENLADLERAKELLKQI